MTELERRLARVRREMDEAARRAGRSADAVTLVAAVKTQSNDTVRAAVAAGIADCGENRVQELTAHLAAGAFADARLHFIGHLQTNKVKEVVGRAALIHSVSSERLLRAIESRAAALGIVQEVLLEVNLAGEASKSGFAPEEALPAARLAATLPHVRVRGLMCIPPIAAAPGANRPYFAKMRALGVDISRKMGDNNVNMDYLSMGMSADFQDAIAEGATHIRLGAALFGPRPPAGPLVENQNGKGQLS